MGAMYHEGAGLILCCTRLLTALWFSISMDWYTYTFTCSCRVYMHIKTTTVFAGRDGGLAWEGLNDPKVAGAIIYSALVPGTLAHLAQAVGQRVVPASEAQVQSPSLSLFGATMSPSLRIKRKYHFCHLSILLIEVPPIWCCERPGDPTDMLSFCWSRFNLEH